MLFRFCTFLRLMEIQLVDNDRLFLPFNTSNQQEQFGGQRRSESPLCPTPGRQDADDKMHRHSHCYLFCFGEQMEQSAMTD